MFSTGGGWGGQKDDNVAKKKKTEEEDRGGKSVKGKISMETMSWPGEVWCGGVFVGCQASSQ